MGSFTGSHPAITRNTMGAVETAGVGGSVGVGVVVESIDEEEEGVLFQ